MPALDLSGARWHKSSRTFDTSNCVEVAVTAVTVAIRDSKSDTGRPPARLDRLHHRPPRR